MLHIATVKFTIFVIEFSSLLHKIQHWNLVCVEKNSYILWKYHKIMTLEILFYLAFDYSAFVCWSVSYQANRISEKNSLSLWFLKL